MTSSEHPIMQVAEDRPPKIRAFLVDDYPIISEVLVELLDMSDDFVVVGTATNGESALEQIAQEKVEIDILLLDLVLPGLSGLEVLKSLQRTNRVRKIVILSGALSDESIAATFGLGANAFVDKSDNLEHLLGVLRAVMKGESPMSERVSQVLRSVVKTRLKRKNLAPTDISVLHQLALQHNIKEIASKLAMSVGAVYKSRARIIERLELNSNADLFSAAAQLGLFSAIETVDKKSFTREESEVKRIRSRTAEKNSTAQDCPTKSRVFLVDDYPIISEVLVDLLNLSGDFVVVGTASNGESALEQIAQERNAIDILILDLVLPGLSGLEVLKSLQRRNLVRTTVILSGALTDESIAATFGLGATAFIDKGDNVENLLVALRAVAKGEPPMNERVSEVLRSVVKTRLKRKKLAPIDLMVLRQLALQHTVKDIAASAEMTAGAIYKSRSRIIERLELSSNADFFAVAAQLGLVPKTFAYAKERVAREETPNSS